MCARFFNSLQIVLVFLVLTSTASLEAQTCEYEMRALPHALTYTFQLDPLQVNSLVAFDDGTGPAVFAGGTFGGAVGVTSRGIAKWGGQSWISLDRGVDFWVTSLAVFDDGSGPALYAGGNFGVAGGVQASSVAKWDGQNWSPLGSGVGPYDGWCPWCIYVTALASFTGVDGTTRLYAGGNFTRAGSLNLNYIAQWNGSTWSALGTGVDRSPVTGFTVFNDGSGPALYVIGNFDLAGGVPGTRRIARWDGLNWSSVGGGLTNEFDIIYDIDVFDDGTGPALYAVGKFDYPQATRHLAKWDGTSWTRLGPMFGNHSITTLGVFDDGGGPQLYLGGTFQIGTVYQIAITVARWNGTGFSPMLPSLGYYILDFLSFNDGTGPVLFTGGQFSLLDGVPSTSITRRSCNQILRGDMNCDEAVNFDDVSHFVQALLAPRNFNGCNTHRADVNGDGKEDGQDIQAFLHLLPTP